jgi:hypothetical protein
LNLNVAVVVAIAVAVRFQNQTIAKKMKERTKEGGRGRDGFSGSH